MKEKFQGRIEDELLSQLRAIGKMMGICNDTDLINHIVSKFVAQNGALLDNYNTFYIPIELPEDMWVCEGISNIFVKWNMIDGGSIFVHCFEIYSNFNIRHMVCILPTRPEEITERFNQLKLQDLVVDEDCLVRFRNSKESRRYSEYTILSEYSLAYGSEIERCKNLKEMLKTLNSNEKMSLIDSYMRNIGISSSVRWRY